MNCDYITIVNFAVTELKNTAPDMGGLLERKPCAMLLGAVTP